MAAEKESGQMHRCLHSEDAAVSLFNTFLSRVKVRVVVPFVRNLLFRDFCIQLVCLFSSWKANNKMGRVYRTENTSLAPPQPRSEKGHFFFNYIKDFFSNKNKKKQTTEQ